MKKIMLIEDNSDNRDLVYAILEDSYDLNDYADGFSALVALQNESLPDLVLCDVSLPGMDGVELIRTLRKQPRFAHLPVIVLTSHAMKGDQERFLAVGFDAYVSKPIVDEEAFIDIIEKLLLRGRP